MKLVGTFNRLTIRKQCITSIEVPEVTVPTILVVAKKYGPGYGALISGTAALIGLILSAALSRAVPGLGTGLAWLIFTYTFPW